MQEYPSIVKAFPPQGWLHTFDKLDGANVRFEYSKQAGFYKCGSRTRLFDATDPVLGGAVALFRDGLERELTRIAMRGHWDRAVVFCEYWGAETIGGINSGAVASRLTPFDVWLPTAGLLEPKLFVKRLGSLGPRYHGRINWSRDFLESVRDGSFDCSFEGVVGKRVERRKRRGKRGPKLQQKYDWLGYKAKTQRWIDAIRARYDSETAEELIQS
jgi:hypothetical protein